MDDPHLEKDPIPRRGIFFNNLLIFAQRSPVISPAEKIIRFFEDRSGLGPFVKGTASAYEERYRYDEKKEKTKMSVSPAPFFNLACFKSKFVI
jgi:hypothetical protein